MATEIERKFLITDDSWRALPQQTKHLRQGYLCNNEQASVRVRIEDQSANINIKSMTIGVSRAEYEYAIPIAEAVELLDKLCSKPQVEKQRHLLNFAGKIWEIDEFSGDNAGLLVAEVELDDVNEAIELPSWAGKEVSDKERYYNMRLGQYPFSQWTDAEKRGE